MGVEIVKTLGKAEKLEIYIYIYICIYICIYIYIYIIFLTYLYSFSITYIIPQSSEQKFNCSILPNFLLLAWFDTLEFNRLSCSNTKMCDDEVFADRFRYQLAMFVILVLIRLSRLFHDHIAYETDCAKIVAAICRISYCLHDLIRLNSIVCHV